MPQLSLYVSEENLDALRARAKEKGVSMSKHVSALIEQDVQSHEWPQGFWKLYGAIADDSFAELADEPPSDDSYFEKAFA